MSIELILGGARSGKSRLAEQKALQSGLAVYYIATAQALDDEMQQRIHHHRTRRPEHWQVIEEPIFLADILQSIDDVQHLVIVDCLTLWLTNLLLHDCPQHFATQRQRLLQVLPQLQSRVILVSNEVGYGIVPLGEINRRFVDESGWLHQEIAAIADTVCFCMAGLTLTLKG